MCYNPNRQVNINQLKGTSFMDNQHFGFSGKKLRLARRAKRLSQTDLASKVDVHRSSIVRWESNLHEPQSGQVLLLAKHLDREPEYFYEWGDFPKPVPVKVVPLIEQPAESLRSLVPQALREAMRKNHDSIFSLAKRLGAEVRTLRLWLSGTELPSLKEVEEIRSVLGEDFNPSPVAYRKISPMQKNMSVHEKLDMLMMRIGRIESLLIQLGA